MRITKTIIHVITVLALLGAIGFGALALKSLSDANGAGYTAEATSFYASFYLYAKLAVGAVLGAILLQIAVIVLKIKNRQDVKREMWVAVFIVGMLVTVPLVLFHSVAAIIAIVLLLGALVKLAWW